MNVILLETNSESLEQDALTAIKIRPVQLHPLSKEFQRWLFEAFWITPEDFARLGLTLVGTMAEIYENFAPEVPADDR